MAKILKIDDNNNAIQTARTFATQDASSTPKTSPLTVSSTEIAIAVPTGAVAFVYTVENYDIRISEVTGMARYLKISAGYGDTLEVADCSFIYVKRDGASDATLHFYFKTI